MYADEIGHDSNRLPEGASKIPRVNPERSEGERWENSS